MLSMTSQPGTTQPTPHYVAELTETQAFVADIPPLVSYIYIYIILYYIVILIDWIGTSRL